MEDPLWVRETLGDPHPAFSIVFPVQFLVCETANLHSIDNLKGPLDSRLCMVLGPFTVNTLGEEKFIAKDCQPKWVCQGLILLGG